MDSHTSDLSIAIITAGFAAYHWMAGLVAFAVLIAIYAAQRAKERGKNER